MKGYSVWLIDRALSAADLRDCDGIDILFDDSLEEWRAIQLDRLLESCLLLSRRLCLDRYPVWWLLGWMKGYPVWLIDRVLSVADCYGIDILFDDCLAEWRNIQSDWLIESCLLLTRGTVTMISCWKSTTATERRKERETGRKRRRRRMGVSKYSTAPALTLRQVPIPNMCSWSGFNCVMGLV